MKGFKITDYIENIVEKGEIADFEQFHLFPQCFLNVFKSHVCQNVRLLAISSGWVGGVYSGLKNHAKNWIKNVVYTS